MPVWSSLPSSQPVCLCSHKVVVFNARVKLRVLIVVAVFVVEATVVALVAVAVDVSDAAVVRAGRQRVGGVMVEGGVVGVARARAARVDERRPMRALDEVAARVDACQQGVEPLVEWVVAVR